MRRLLSGPSDMRSREHGTSSPLPLWCSSTIDAEPILLLPRDSGAPAGRLLFRPDTVERVADASGQVEYAVGRDYIIDTADRLIVRTADSRMPLHPPGAHNGLTHALLSTVTYTHREPWFGATVEFGGDRLPRTTARLREGGPLTISVTGDSISEGYDASGFHGFAPYAPPYAALVARGLTEHCGSVIQLHNLATAGWTAEHGLWDVDRIAASSPHLVVVAYGMNDATYADADAFTANMREIIGRVRRLAPAAEFVVVSPMLPTAQCTFVLRRRIEEYELALRTLIGEGVALADVTAIWADLVTRKDPRELAGNGLNHPNDFGHRVYADVVLRLLVPPR